jgi:hypothetical protein
MMPAKISTVTARVAMRHSVAGNRRDAHHRARRETMKPTVERRATTAAEATCPGFCDGARRYEGKGGHKADGTRAIDHHTDSYAVQPHH